MTFFAIFKNTHFWLNAAKWLVLFLVIGILSGTASAFFLVALDRVSHIRETYCFMYWWLPVGGLFIGLCYHYFGKSVLKGNDLLLESYQNPERKISFVLFPLILISTLITHLFGGSAGREGTAVQMGVAISNVFSKWVTFNKINQRVLIILGISAGFSSVFGTPWAGAVFALEIMCFQNLKIKTIIGSFTTAFVAYYTVEILQVSHTKYHISQTVIINPTVIFWVILAGILFGLTALLFAKNTAFWLTIFNKFITFPILRPFIGGFVLIAIFSLAITKPYMGLGISTIADSFKISSAYYVFILKLILTGFTLGAGFKGGEVTPLFFVGATLGSFLAIYFPLPLSLLAGLGFVAVFAGATNAPLAASLMGLEIFGTSNVLLIIVACFTAYFCSGNKGIYNTQFKTTRKFYWVYWIRKITHGDQKRTA